MLCCSRKTQRLGDAETQRRRDSEAPVLCLSVCTVSLSHCAEVQADSVLQRRRTRQAVIALPPPGPNAARDTSYNSRMHVNRSWPRILASLTSRKAPFPRGRLHAPPRPLRLSPRCLLTTTTPTLSVRQARLLQNPPSEADSARLVQFKPRRRSAPERAAAGTVSSSPVGHGRRCPPARGASIHG